MNKTSSGFYTAKRPEKFIDPIKPFKSPYKAY